MSDLNLATRSDTTVAILSWDGPWKRTTRKRHFIMLTPCTDAGRFSIDLAAGPDLPRSLLALGMRDRSSASLLQTALTICPAARIALNDIDLAIQNPRGARARVWLCRPAFRRAHTGRRRSFRAEIAGGSRKEHQCTFLCFCCRLPVTARLS